MKRGIRQDPMIGGSGLVSTARLFSVVDPLLFPCVNDSAELVSTLLRIRWSP